MNIVILPDPFLTPYDGPTVLDTVDSRWGLPAWERIKAFRESTDE